MIIGDALAGGGGDPSGVLGKATAPTISPELGSHGQSNNVVLEILTNASSSHCCFFLRRPKACSVQIV